MRIFEDGSRELAEARSVLFQCGLDLQNIFQSDETGLSHSLEADLECGSVILDFLCGRTNRWIPAHLSAKQLVLGRNDILDGRAVLSLLESQCIDED